MMASIRNRKGATLIELIFSIAIMLVVAGSFYQLLISFYQNYEVQNAIAEMQQQGRVAVDLISREIRQAGYDPTGEVFREDKPAETKKRKIRCLKKKYDAERIFEATPTVFHFLADLNANGKVDNGDKNKPDVDEHIHYEWIGADSVDSCGIKTKIKPYTLVRDSGGGRQGVAPNIESFQLDYYDENGVPIPSNALTDPSQRERIRKVVVTLRVRTERRDPRYEKNEGYRTRRFVSEVWLKNM
ncbi:MAG: prepilin-type N-terminal cleavage/methylation domain-containing protein [Nitrospiria bacterium]